MRLSVPRDTARRATLLVLATFGFLTVYFTGTFPPWANPNELSRFQTVVSMAEWKTFSIDRAVALLGNHEDMAVSGGRFYSNKAPGLAFAAYPVYRLLRLALPAPKEGTSDPIFYFVRLFTVSLAAAFALVRFAARLRETRATPSAAPLTILAVALGTSFLFYARSFFSHAWTASLLFLAWDLLRRGEEPSARRRKALAAAAGLLAGWAVISEYNAAPVAVLLGLRAAAGPERRRVAAFLLGAAPPVVALLVYDTICFGSPWTLSSAREAAPEYAQLIQRGIFGFGMPSLRVAVAYLFDPARGVLLFSPFFLWFFVGLARWWGSGEERTDCVFVIATVAVYFVLLTAYPNWHGGWSLGSRYLLPVLFFAGLPIVRALETPLSRGLFLAAAAWSVATHWLLTASWVHFPIDLPWPAATGSLWFVTRGWIAQNLASLAGARPWIALAAPFGLTAASLVVVARAARPTRPAVSVAVLAGLAPLLVLLLRPPEPAFAGRLWRASVFGAFSGRDPGREELKAVALEASSPEERRRAMWAWRVYGPRSSP